MDDTHDPTLEGDASKEDAIAELAELDPADAPAAAEALAADLASELEAAGTPAPEPVQLRADLGDDAGS